jgi:hypothetical protein
MGMGIVLIYSVPYPLPSVLLTANLFLLIQNEAARLHSYTCELDLGSYMARCWGDRCQRHQGLGMPNVIHGEQELGCAVDIWPPENSSTLSIFGRQVSNLLLLDEERPFCIFSLFIPDEHGRYTPSRKLTCIISRQWPLPHWTTSDCYTD